MRKICCVLFIALLVTALPLIAQQKPAQTMPMGKHTMMHHGDMDACRQMMAEHQKMMDQMGDMDKQLEALVTKMNSATGQAKIDAMAEVINKLIDQRKTMREMMTKDRAQMMDHMMEHHMKGGMADCPMMKEMTKQ